MVADVTIQECRRYIEERRRQGVGDGTCRRELGVLRAAFRHCVEAGRLSFAPAVMMPPPPPGRERWLTKTEAARLLWESRRDQRVRHYLPLFIMIGLYTGARRGAILGLKWSQLDLDRGRIDFNEPDRPRTKKQRAVLPVPRRLRTFLVLARGRSSSEFVLNYNGVRLDDLKKSFRSAARRAGLIDVTPHTLRHTCGTWLAQAGVPLYQVAGWLGHSYERTTELYAHHHPDHLGEARKAMERKR